MSNPTRRRRSCLCRYLGKEWSRQKKSSSKHLKTRVHMIHSRNSQTISVGGRTCEGIRIRPLMTLFELGLLF